MKNKDARKFAMFIRVRAFGVAQNVDFPTESAGATAFATLDEVISGLTRLHDDQISKKGTRREQLTTKSAAREAILDDLRAINRTAQSLAFEKPGLDRKFRLPREGGAQAMLSTARAFIAEARPLKESFILHDLPADFIEDLEADIAVFERIHDGQATTTIGGVQITRAIDDTVRRGLETVKRLDAIVRNKYRANPAIIAAWETASHIERAVAAKAPVEAAGETQS